MRPVDDPDAGVAAREVDSVRWLAPEQARSLLGYGRELVRLDAV